MEFDNSQLVSRIWKVGLAVFRNYAIGMRDEIRAGGSGGDSDVCVDSPAIARHNGIVVVFVGLELCQCRVHH